MADEKKIGTPWRDHELDAIVADYFEMLEAELSGRCGRQRLLEVKTTNGAARTPFFLTRNEREMAAERPADWRIYRVHLFATEPRIFTIAPPLEKAVNLRPETWRASFGM